jgi:hypothetical protein
LCIEKFAVHLIGKVTRWRIPTIACPNKDIKLLDCLIVACEGGGYKVHEGALGHYKRLIADFGLFLRRAENENCYNRISSNEKQREKAYPVFDFVEISTLWLESGILFYYGLPRRDGYGFTMILFGLLCYMHGLGLLLHLSENAFASEIGASATCYRGAKDVRVIAVVVAPFEFSDVQQYG